MDLATTLSQFYNPVNVQSFGCIHHIYPTNDKNGFPMGNIYLPEIISCLEGLAEISQWKLVKFGDNGFSVYDTHNKILGTIIIHML